MKIANKIGKIKKENHLFNNKNKLETSIKHYFQVSQGIKKCGTIVEHFKKNIIINKKIKLKIQNF